MWCKILLYLFRCRLGAVGDESNVNAALKDKKVVKIKKCYFGNLGGTTE